MSEHLGHPDQGDYFANHARARQFPWTLYHQPLEKDLAKFLGQVAVEQPRGEVLVVGCGLLHEIDAAPEGGCALAVCRKLVRSGRLSPESSVVVFNTGSGASYRFQ